LIRFVKNQPFDSLFVTSPAIIGQRL